jgi:hypothetical protein
MFFFLTQLTKPHLIRFINTKNELHVSNEPIRSKAKTLKKILNGLIVQVLTKTKHGNHLEHQEQILIHLIHI